MNKISLKSIQEFTSIKTLAIVGVSSSGKKYSDSVYSALLKKDYTLYPVNNKINEYKGVKCFNNISQLPENVKA